jgi:phage/plasmid-like protein (TIGR03299 family)
MAHEVETMAYANATPWHGLGARVDSSVSIEEMQKAAGLDWEILRLPLKVGQDENTPEEFVGRDIPERFAHVRSSDGKVMAVADPRWSCLQPRAALEFMKNYVEAGAATLETAGSLRGGRVVWGLARLSHSFEVTRGDKVNGYLLITSPNEVGKAITVRTTTVRVVCANTMALAMSGGRGETHYRQSHMGAFNEEAAKEAIGNASEHLLRAEQNAKTLNKLKLSISDSITKVLAPVFYPTLLEDEEAMNALQMPETQPKVLAEILNSVENGAGGDVSAGTGWGLLNGVTHWADHVAGRSQEARMHKAWLGENATRKLAVEAKLLELVS